MRILMVCLGNICRSPLAEGILAARLKDKGDLFTVDSAGTGAWHIGSPPDHRSVAVAKKYGLDISTQRARQITKKDFDSFDLILTLDDDIHQEVLAMTQNTEHHKKIHLLRTYAGHQESLVPDPYTGDMEDFENVYQLIDDACMLILKKMGS